MSHTEIKLNIWGRLEINVTHINSPCELIVGSRKKKEK